MPMVDIDWLKDHVEVPEGFTYEQLAKDLVKVGLEEEERQDYQLVPRRRRRRIQRDR